MSDAKSKIEKLVEKFDRNLSEYKHPKYNETQIRVEFINPFWEALGWDVNNRAGYALSFRDVIHEDDIKVGGSTKAPDYSFRIGGRRVFFLEAKKPAVDLKHNPEPAFQLRRYAYSAKLPVSMLTDFEELSIYDTRLKPAISDKAHIGRMHYYTYAEYADKWDEINATLSKEAVLRGDFNRFIEDKQAKRPGAELDRDFLASLDEWRMLLARNIALRNPGLSERELNFAVQMTIDRLIFLRMAEDRGIETYGTLQALQNGEQTYPRLVEIYYRADERYNSGLFHFSGKDGEHPDTVTPGLALDDKVLKEIIKNLYYPCPYEFSEFPVEVLGNAYEQFLGKRISLTSGHRARIEEKPEVRKAGGVYYTPQYIVDYIVEHTVGELVQDKSPQQVSDLRIVDPACGSGSFLLGAFQYLMDWHLQQYMAAHEADGAVPASPPPAGRKPRKSDPQAMFQGVEGEWYLTTAEKKRILLNNIYGVDIDANAVEVTKLSLLLKVLEHEDSETLNRQLGLWHERALPNLSGNIKCGNSLIGPDYYDNQQSALFDEEELHRVNAFDWQSEFAEVFAQGGFDAVIGNPPYIGFHGFKEDKQYLISKFITAKGKFDLYLPFIENAIRLLKKDGILGYICPTNFMKRGHGIDLRSYLSKNISINEIIDFGHKQIFDGATNYTGVYIFLNTKPDENSKIQYKTSLEHDGFKVSQKEIDETPWIFRREEETTIIKSILKSVHFTLDQLSIGISEGIVTGKNDVFLLDKKRIEELDIEKKYLKPCLRGKNIHPYYVNDPSEYVIYPYQLKQNKTIPIKADMLKENENLWSYLKKSRESLKGRGYFEKSNKEWYELWCQRDLKQLAKKKIVVPELAEKNRFAIVDENIFYGDTVCGITLKDDVFVDIRFILGILNSKLIEFYFKKTSVPKAGGYYIYKTMFLKNIPIRKIDFENHADKAAHDRLVELVQQMLELHRRRAESGDPRTREMLDRHITTTDQHIDRLVYELYGLTEEEIKIVEGSTS